VTVREAILPAGAVFLLGIGVYLLIEVRAQPVPPPPMRQDRAARAAAPPVSAPAPRAPVAEPQQETIPAAPRPAAPPDPPAPAPAPSLASREPSAPAPELDGPLVGPKLDAVMAEANKAYDRGDYEDAKLVATRVLATHPTNVRMLRIMVSASCIDGDSAVAQAHYARLPPADQEQMKIRCARYGVVFADAQ
jgi:hypothetical protein